MSSEPFSSKLSVKIPLASVNDLSKHKFNLLDDFYLEGNRDKREMRKPHYPSSKITEKELEKIS